MPIQDITPQTALQFGNTILVVQLKINRRTEPQNGKFWKRTMGARQNLLRTHWLLLNLRTQNLLLSLFVRVCGGIINNSQQ